MPHALSITDGTTTISLSTSNVILQHYVPKAPTFNKTALRYENVVEPIELAIKDTTTANVQAKLHAIETLLWAAVERAVTSTGPRCYLLFTPIGDVQQRSEILSFELIPGDKSNQSFGQAIIECRLLITRRPYWEGPRTAVAGSNGNGTNVTSGLTIRNHDDSTAGHDNYFDIAAGVIGGSLPTPLEVKLTNTSGSALQYLDFFLANNTYNPALAHIIEAETALSGWGTAAVFSNTSNGSHATVAGTGWHNFRWTVPTATLGIMRGRFLRILSRFTQLSGSRKVQVSLWNWDGTWKLAEAPPTYTTAYGAIQDCGALPFPPAGYASFWSTCQLQLSVYTDASETVGVDYVQLTPTEPLHLRRFYQIGYSVPNNSAVVDDGIEELTYLDDAGSKYPIYISRSEPLHAWPAVAQRLYVLVTGAGISVDNTFSMQVWQRARRITW